MTTSRSEVALTGRKRLRGTLMPGERAREREREREGERKKERKREGKRR